MAQCIICKEFVPPTFSVDTKDKKAKICVFCDRGTNTIEKLDEKTGTINSITKKETVKSYKEYIDFLKNKKNITKFLNTGEDDE